MHSQLRRDCLGPVLAPPPAKRHTARCPWMQVKKEGMTCYAEVTSLDEVAAGPQGGVSVRLAVVASEEVWTHAALWSRASEARRLLFCRLRPPPLAEEAAAAGGRQQGSYTDALKEELQNVRQPPPGVDVFRSGGQGGARAWVGPFNSRARALHAALCS